MTLPEDHGRRIGNLPTGAEKECRPVIDRCRIPLNALRAFEAAGRHLSFAAGAQSLRVTYGAVRRQVASLEDLLQAKLIIRQNSSLTLTPQGENLLRIVSRSFDEIEIHLNSIQSRGRRSQDRIRLILPPLFLHQVALPLLRDVRNRFPQISLDVSLEEPSTAKWVYDLSVTHGSLNGDLNPADLLWPCRIAVFCAPALALRDTHTSLSSYFETATLLHVSPGQQPSCPDWLTFAARTGIRIDDRRGIVFNSQASAIEYALAGGGLVLSDATLLESAVARGALVQPCTESYPDGSGYFLSVQSREPASSYFAELCRALADRGDRTTMKEPAETIADETDRNAKP